jgi:hypothetical protein
MMPVYTKHQHTPFGFTGTFPCDKMSYMRIVTCLFVIIGIFSCSTDANNEMNQRQAVDSEANRKAVGASAGDLLGAAEFSSLRLELFYVEGTEPHPTAIDNLENFLSERLNKPGTIEIQLKALASPGKATYSIDDIRGLEDQNRTTYNDSDQIAVFGLFIDGEYDQNSENSSVLGVAYRNTSFVLFGETIREFGKRPLAPARHVLETAVLLHEFGHLLGLVNAGTPLQNDHQDVEHGRHCDVEDCLMYWTAETGEGLLNLITGGTAPALDAQCIADLKANGGK